MGRNRTFVEEDVIALCADAFRQTGYEGTSIDDLVQATGLHRGSLYKAFGSKRGLFILAVKSAATRASVDETTDLLLVSLMELAPRDPEVRAITLAILASSSPPRTPHSLGIRLLDRAAGSISAEMKDDS